MIGVFYFDPRNTEKGRKPLCYNERSNATQNPEGGSL